MSDDITGDSAVIKVSDLVKSLDECETWVPAYGWPEYAVSSWGRIRRDDNILKPAITHGYQFVTLSSKGCAKPVRIHKLVLLSFYGTAPFEGAICAHNDGNKLNNRASNLRWASLAENSADMKRHKTQIRGSEVFGAKLTEKDLPKIRQRIRNGETNTAIAPDFGVSASTISLIKRNRIWTHA